MNLHILLCCLEQCTVSGLLRHHGEEYRVSGTSEASGDQYNYAVIIGKSITQVSKGGHGSWLIGKFKRFTGYKDAATQLYGNGEGCGSGITRKAKVTFFAGTESQMLEASEPSTCNYEFSMQINCKAGNIIVLILVSQLSKLYLFLNDF